MQESSIQTAIFDGVRELKQEGLVFDPHQIALGNHFQGLSSDHSGAIALPLAKARSNNGYRFIEITGSAIKTPDTTIETLWDCTKEHFGLTAATGLAVYGSIPLDKMKLGYFVQRGASVDTNIISHYGLKFFPRARLRAGTTAARLAKAAFGTIRIFGIVGRAMPFVAVGLAVIDVVSIGMCTYETRNGK